MPATFAADKETEILLILRREPPAAEAGSHRTALDGFFDPPRKR